MGVFLCVIAYERRIKDFIVFVKILSYFTFKLTPVWGCKVFCKKGEDAQHGEDQAKSAFQELGEVEK